MPEPYDSLILVTPFPDGETVNSLLSRLADFRNDCSLKAMSRQLLARGEGLDDMPSRLDIFYTRVGHLFGDRKLLEARHTLLQYWLLGLPPEKHATQRARLWSQCSGPIRLAHLPVMLAPSEGRHLVCPECAEEALDQYGFAFVHRRNVAPFVRTCPLHFCEMRSTARQVSLFDTLCRLQSSRRQFRDTVEFAIRSTSCVEDSNSTSRYSKAAIIATLRQSQWLNENNRARVTEFAGTFTSFFRNRFDDRRLETLVSGHEYVAAALRALMRDDRALHTVWCILFAWFAEYCERRRPQNVSGREPEGKLLRRERTNSIRETTSNSELYGQSVGRDVNACGPASRKGPLLSILPTPLPPTPERLLKLRRDTPERLNQQSPQLKSRHVPLRQRRSEALLTVLCHAADSAADNLDSRACPPIRRSCYRLRAVLGISEYALNSSLPAPVLGAFTQSRDEYISRRIRWAADHGAPANSQEWYVARVARLRQETLKNWKNGRRKRA
ncbi:TniQ family protein [Burkholderia arboris]|uniref:TniQ family protein n=1 Tax=Burkholderia arboris TaxID=488730 RepID=UPI00384FCA8E